MITKYKNFQPGPYDNPYNYTTGIMNAYTFGVSPAEQEVIFALVKSINTIDAIEIGTYTGASAEAIISALQPTGKLFCIDWFLGDPIYGVNTIEQGSSAITFLRDRIKNIGHDKKLVTIISDSNEIDYVFKTGFFDFLFLDYYS